MSERNDKFEDLQNDIEKIKQINIVPAMLQLICSTTKMGFAAIARVTDEKWIACSVRDEINFGLKEGGELQLETTICNEIRTSKQAVIIDEVSTDPAFCNHATPAMYGFQSYISIPIILENGYFFGTLCAIDPKPALLNTTEIKGMFDTFVKLLAFHLHAVDTLDRSKQGFKEATDETSRYEHITYHQLREPVRKISIYSDLISTAGENADYEKMKTAAVKIKQCTLELSKVLQQINTN